MSEKNHHKPFVKGDDKYRSIIENMKLGLLEVDLEGVINYANDSFCEMVGYSKEELVNHSASGLFVSVGSLSEALVAEHSSKRLKGEHSVYEIQVTKKNGTRIWVMISGGPLYDEGGEIVGTIGIHHDFTERHSKDESLKRMVRELAFKNKEFMRKTAFLKAVNTFSKLIADKSTIADVVKVITENVIERLGFDDCVVYILEEDVLVQGAAFGEKKDNDGKVASPIQIPLGKGIVGEVAKNAKAEIIGDTSKDERYIVDDKFRYSEIAVPIIHDNEVLGVIDSENKQKFFYTEEDLEILQTVANLVSARLKSVIAWEKATIARGKLELSESKFRNIINTALDAVVMIDNNGMVTEWNDQAQDVFGYTREETVGKRLSKLIIPQQYKASHEKGMQKFHKTGEGPVLNQRIEISAVRKNEEEFPIELSITPIPVDDTYYFSAFIRDISEQKANQKKIEKSLERERELNDLKSKFVSMASHEFRTPLTTIKVNVDLMEHRLSKVENNEAIIKNLTRIDNEVERLKSLMNDVLTIGRIQAGKIDLNLQKANLSYLVNKVIEESFSNQSDGRKTAFTVYGKEKEVSIDSSIFSHIISNLISNAFKYSADSDEPEVIIEFKKDFAHLIVRDHGIGIPKDDLESISETFFRASNVGNIQGSGVGLAIVNQFVELHHGTMEIESEENIGTTVIVKIPF